MALNYKDWLKLDKSGQSGRELAERRERDYLSSTWILPLNYTTSL